MSSQDACAFTQAPNSGGMWSIMKGPSTTGGTGPQTDVTLQTADGKVIH